MHWIVLRDKQKFQIPFPCNSLCSKHLSIVLYCEAIQCTDPGRTFRVWFVLGHTIKLKMFHTLAFVVGTNMVLLNIMLIFVLFPFFLTQDKKTELIEPEADESKVKPPIFAQYLNSNQIFKFIKHNPPFSPNFWIAVRWSSLQEASQWHHVPARDQLWRPGPSRTRRTTWWSGRPWSRPWCCRRSWQRWCCWWLCPWSYQAGPCTKDWKGRSFWYEVYLSYHWHAGVFILSA